MPVTKIELAEGQTDDYIQKLMRVYGDALVKTLNLPDDDRNIRVLEYKKSNFAFKPPYEILIEITLFAGRSKETKALLYKNLVEAFEKKLSIQKEKIFIILCDQPQENWGIRGGISADKIEFEFKVNV